MRATVAAPTTAALVDSALAADAELAAAEAEAEAEAEAAEEEAEEAVEAVEAAAEAEAEAEDDTDVCALAALMAANRSATSRGMIPGSF